METLQIAEHVSEGNKSSSLLSKQIQSLLFRQKGTAALPQQPANLSPRAALASAALWGGGEGGYYPLGSAQSLKPPQHCKGRKRNGQHIQT